MAEIPRKYQIKPENAALIWTWLQTRGGIAIWDSINLSNPGGSWTTPATDQAGNPALKPTWQVGNEPSRIITDPADVEVVVPHLWKRFHVGVRVGRQGLSLKVTEGGTRRIRAALHKAGEGAWHEFDYEAQDALIYIPAKTVPISEWIAQQGAAA